MPREWIKLWRHLLEGTTIEELTPEERWVWISLLLLANDEGVIMRGEYSNGKRLGYSLESLAHKICVAPDVVQRTIEKCKLFEKLEYEITNVHGLKGYVITIKNWKKYQSTYTESHRRYYEKQKTKKDDAEQKKQSTSEKTSSQISPSQVRTMYEEIVEEKFADFDDDIRELILQTLEVIPLTRKTGKISSAFLDKLLESLRKYDEEIIEEGLSKYLEAKLYEKGKKENYLLGILRGIKQEKEIKKKHEELNQKRTKEDMKRELARLQEQVEEYKKAIKKYDEYLAQEVPGSERYTEAMRYKQEAFKYLAETEKRKKAVEEELRKLGEITQRGEK